MDKAVVFDMDGTIFDSEKLVYECWKKIGPKFGFNNLDTLFYRVIGGNIELTHQVFIKEYGEDIPYYEFRDAARTEFFERIERDGIPMKPGVTEILEYLSANNCKLALASSTSLEVVTKELKMAKIYDYFDTVIGGNMVKRSKPKPDIYLEALRRLNAENDMAYAIEDSYNGIRSAYAAGLLPIMVPDMEKPNDEMREKAYLIKNNLYEVLDFFKHTCNEC